MAADIRNETLWLQLPDNRQVSAVQPFSDADRYQVDPVAGTFVLARNVGEGLGAGEAELLELTAAGDTVWQRLLRFDPIPVATDSSRRASCSSTGPTGKSLARVRTAGREPVLGGSTGSDPRKPARHAVRERQRQDAPGGVVVVDHYGLDRSYRRKRERNRAFDNDRGTMRSSSQATFADDESGSVPKMKTSVLIAVLLATACTGSGSSDSVGDEIAANRIVEPVIPEKRLSLVEELRIGSVMGGDGVLVLHRVTDLEVGPGGEIYALDEDYVRVFSPTGESLRSWGGGGEGPGEFQGTIDMALARDTVAVTDGDRVHFFDRGGRFLNSVWPGGRPGAGYLALRIHSTELGWVV